MPTPGQGRAILLVLAALACFAVLDAVAKSLATRYPVAWLVWGRYAVHLAFMLIVLWPRHGMRLVRTAHPWLHALRGLMLTGVTGLNIAALATMPLAEATALLFVAPVLVATLAGPWLGERMDARKWIAVLCGFAGVLLIVRPGFATDAVIPLAGVALSLAAAGCYAIYQLLTRQLSPTDDALTLLFHTALVGTLATTLAMPWFAASAWPDAGDTALIASLGLFGGGGHFMLIQAYRHTAATTLSPLYYTQLVWATLIGLLAFGHWPDPLALTGIAIIAASGVLVAIGGRRRPS